jgi:hypothetical protein
VRSITGKRRHLTHCRPALGVVELKRRKDKRRKRTWTNCLSPTLGASARAFNALFDVLEHPAVLVVTSKKGEKSALIDDEGKEEEESAPFRNPGNQHLRNAITVAPAAVASSMY